MSTSTLNVMFFTYRVLLPRTELMRRGIQATRELCREAGIDPDTIETRTPYNDPMRWDPVEECPYDVTDREYLKDRPDLITLYLKEDEVYFKNNPQRAHLRTTLSNK